MPPDSAAAAELLARLLTDDRFRSEFRRDPAGTCREMNLEEVADELTRESGRAFQTLEIRESRSSLAGVLLAAAAEGVGMAELIQTVRGGDGDRWHAAGALSAAMPAVHQAGLPVGLSDGGPVPTCPLCMLKDPTAPATIAKCGSCGGPAPLGSTLCPICRAERRSAPTVRPFASAQRSSLSFASSQQGDHVEAFAVTPVAAPIASTPTVEPIDPSLLDSTNAGGKLHGSEFNVRDAEGAPGPTGNLHAGYDLFGQENAPIRSPIAGTIVEVRASRGTSGQIFGGTVKVEGADGRVWVFRHVSPGSVSVGQPVAAGTQIAAISPWTDGPEHTHIEVWKSFAGGYNVPNMEDPLPYLQALYPEGGAPPLAGVPAAVGAPPVVGAPVNGAPPVIGAPPPLPVAAPVAVSPGDVIANPQIVAAPAVQAEIASPDLDPRAVPMLAQLAGRYEIGITSVESDGDISRIIISSVNGKPVDLNNVDARDLAQELAALDPSARPSEVGTPWRIQGQGFFTEPGLHNRIEVGYRAGDLPTAPVVPAPVGAPAIPPPAPVGEPPAR